MKKILLKMEGIKMQIKHFRFLILFFLIFLAGCTSSETRLNESGYNTEFLFTNDVTFSDYIKESKRIIEIARIDLNDKNRKIIIEANSPFELVPDINLYTKNQTGKFQKGILLIHGLTDSPYFLRPVAEHLRSRGFLVRGILLPGCGTVPGDLLSVEYESWIKAVEYGMYRLKQNCNELYIGGFSIGGALSLNYSMTHPDEIKGMLLFAPALGIKSKAAWLTVYLKYFKKWLDIYDDLDFSKYESLAINGAAQTWKLVKENDKYFYDRNEPVNPPVFAVISTDDQTVDSDKTLELFKTHVKSKQKKLIVYTTTPIEYNEEYIITGNSSLPENRIINFSHVSVLIPPDDIHYGINGDYRSCLQFYTEQEMFDKCQNESEIWLGEINENNLEFASDNNLIIARLTFNPYFDLLLEQMDDFLDSIKN